MTPQQKTCPHGKLHFIQGQLMLECVQCRMYWTAMVSGKVDFDSSGVAIKDPYVRVTPEVKT